MPFTTTIWREVNFKGVDPQSVATITVVSRYVTEEFPQHVISYRGPVGEILKAVAAEILPEVPETEDLQELAKACITFQDECREITLKFYAL